MSKLFNKIIYFESLDSTNNYIIRLYKDLSFKNDLMVVANNQKNGRGRMGKKWFSDSNSLTFSFSIPLNPAINAWEINMLISVVLVKVLNKLGVKSMIKYPNDIIVNNKKIAGILTEVISINMRKYCIIGVGVNINNTNFPLELTRAISIRQFTTNFIDKYDFINDINHHLGLFFPQISEIKKIYFSYLYGAKDFIKSYFNSKFIEVKILDLNSHGYLTLLTRENIKEEVSDLDVKFLLN